MEAMFSQVSMPSTSSVLSAYTTFAASAMVVKTMLHEVKTMAKQLIPQQLQDKILSGIRSLIGDPSSQMMTLVIDEYNGYAMNQIFEASEVYLQTKITSTSLSRLRVSRAPRENNILVTIGKGEKVVDEFQGIQLKWEMVSSTDHQKQSPMGGGDHKGERRSIELSFLKKHTEKVMESYLPYVVERAETIKEEKKVVKLYSLGNPVAGGGAWGSINLDHPSTFETMAMDLEVKEELIKDLERFVRRREFYKRVGKAWKRGYLLYGPPGTGKTSLIAAMANYLKFDVYDLEVTSLQRNSQLRKILVSTKNRSILVIEDIDCTADIQDRQLAAAGRINNPNTQLTLSGLLNFIDGLWSSCGDERIIVFTTNHKERLDPALLRPGRMDMHIHMSYCTPYGFKTLASNYLGVTNHTLFSTIERLITEVEVTPAQIAEELMKSAATQEPHLALQALVDFLNNIVNAPQTGAGKHQLPLHEPHVQTKRQKIWGEGIEGFDFMPPVSALSVL